MIFSKSSPKVEVCLYPPRSALGLPHSQPHQSNHPLIHIDLKDKSFKQRLILEQSIQQMSMEDFVKCFIVEEWFSLEFNLVQEFQV